MANVVDNPDSRHRFGVSALRFGALAAVVALAANCATPPPADDSEAMAAFKEANDPLEPFNRAMFSVNMGLDRAIIRPVAEGYRAALPDGMRDSVRNFLNNLRTPVILANDVLQGEVERAGHSLGRFMINSTIGVGGLFDVAAMKGEHMVESKLPFHNEDFGQTLGAWGIGEGAYLVLPLLGPSPPRDTVGLVGDAVMDPWGYLIRSEYRYALAGGRFALRGIDTRSRNIETLDEIERSSIDFYATIRSLYRQRRVAEIANGRDLPESPVPEISFDFDDKEEEKISRVSKD